MEPRKGTTPGRLGKKGILTQLDVDTARRLKILAVTNDTTLQALGVEAFEALLERYGGLSALADKEYEDGAMAVFHGIRRRSGATMRTAGYWTPSAGRRWQREAVPPPPRLAPLASEGGGTFI